MIQVAKTGNQLSINTPPFPPMTVEFKKIGAKWNGSSWAIDARLEKEVKSLLREHLGTSGEGDVIQLVDVEMTVTETLIGDHDLGYNKALCLFGRVIATAKSRDSGAWIGDGVAVIEGEITSGGSARYFDARIVEGSKIKIFDVPYALVETQKKSLEGKAVIEIISDTEEFASDTFSIEGLKKAFEAGKGGQYKTFEEFLPYFSK